MLDAMATLPPDPLAGFDFDTAQREGWTLSETCDLTGKPLVQMQALDRDALPSGIASLLPSDRAAWDLVTIRAGPDRPCIATPVSASTTSSAP